MVGMKTCEGKSTVFPVKAVFSVIVVCLEEGGADKYFLYIYVYSLVKVFILL